MRDGLKRRYFASGCRAVIRIATQFVLLASASLFGQGPDVDTARFVRVETEGGEGLARSDRMLVLVADGVGQEEIQQDLETIGAREIGRFGRDFRGRVLEALAQQGSNQNAGDRRDRLALGLRELAACGSFAVVEPDWVVSIQETPTDSGFVNGDLWGLRNRGANGGQAGVDISAEEAWRVTTGSPEVLVGVVDSGIRYTHNDLSANLWRNPGETPNNGLDDDGNGWVDDVFGINAIENTGDPWDDNGHGTHVAGTIVAQGNNAEPAVGVAWRSRAIALKFLNENGRGSVSDAIKCIEYGLSQGVRVFNNSWGGAPFSEALFEAIQSANEQGAFFVVAAGNNSRSNEQRPQYPSNYDVPNVISVAALDRDGSLSRFSNFGVTTVDIAAPGSEIFSTEADADNAYGFRSGTSMAAPHVSGVAALLWSAYPVATLEEIRWRLLNTATRTEEALGFIGTSGWVDAGAALSAVDDGAVDLYVNYEVYPLPGGGEADVYLTAFDLGPALGGRVEARIGNEAWTQLVDHGVSPDRSRNDGIYTGTLVIPNGVESARLSIQYSFEEGVSETLERDVSIQPMPPGIQLVTRDYRLDSGEESIVLSADSMTDSLATGENGSLFATYTSDRGIVISRSLDDGRTFTRRSILSPDRVPASIDVSRDGSKIVAAWVSPDGELTVCQSVDGGDVYSVPEVVHASQGERSFARVLIHRDQVFVLEADGARLWRASVDRGFGAEWDETLIDTGATTGGIFASKSAGPLWAFTVDPFLRLFVSDDMGQSFRRFSLSADESMGPLVLVDPDVSDIYGAPSPKVLIAGLSNQGFEIDLDTGDVSGIGLQSMPGQRSVAVDHWGRVFDGFLEKSSIQFRFMANRDVGFSDSVFIGSGSIHTLIPSADGGGLVALRQSEDRVSVSRFDLGALSPGASRLDFVGLPGDSLVGSLSLENDGAQRLTIDINTTEPWLSVEPKSLEIPPGGRREIEVLIEDAPNSEFSSEGKITMVSDDRVSPERTVNIVFWRRAEIEDDRLANALVERIGVDRARLRRRDIAELESLDATDAGIQSLEGLQFATRLASLRVGHNEITAILPISNLVNLESLTLNENPIETIAPLSGLTQLKTLLISNASLVDISSLSALDRLELLSLENNEIESVAPLNALTRLRRLFLSGNKIASIEDLRTLSQLVELRVRDNLLETLIGLENAAGLRTLDASRNRLTSIDPIVQLSGLETVRVARNRIEFVPDLQRLSALKYLDMGRNHLRSLDGLLGLKSLIELDLGNNNIGRLDGIGEMNRLELLWLQGNRIFDPSPLEELTELKDLTQPVVSEDESFRFLWEGLRLENNLIPILSEANRDMLARLESRVGLSVNYASQRSALETVPLAPVLAVATGQEGRAFFSVENLSDFDLLIEWSSPESWVNVHPNSGLLPGRETLEFLAQSGPEAPAIEDDLAMALHLINPLAALEPIEIVVSPMAIFENERLELAVRDGIVEHRNTLSAAHLRGLERLSVESAGIKSLKGLEWASNLKFLNLANNSVKDLSPLSGLVKLRSLDVGGNRVTGLDTLSALSALRWLDVSGNEIEDLEGLAPLRGLQSIIANENRIRSLAPLHELREISELRLGRNRIDSLEPLERLTRLAYLDVGFNDLESLVGVGELDALERIIAPGNRIDNIDALQWLPRLQALDLNGNEIRVFDQWDSIPGLRQLDMGGNLLSEFSIPNADVGIEALWLNHNRLTSLRGLERLASIGAGSSIELSIGNADAPPNVALRLEGNFLDLTSEMSPERLALLELRDSVDFQATLEPQSPALDLIELPDSLAVASEQPLDVAFKLMNRQLSGGLFEWRVLTPGVSVEPRFGRIEALGSQESMLRINASHSLRFGDRIELELHSLNSIYRFAIDVSAAVAISDAALESALRDTLGLSAEVVIKVSDMARLETLNAANRGIRELSGIEFAVNLRHANLSNNDIDDLASLDGLDALETLWIRDNDIVDLRPLSTLSGLRSLDIGGNLVSDVSPLAWLDGLRVLNAERNRIQDVQSLGVLHALVELNLRQNQLQSLVGLAGLSDLEEARVQQNSLTSLEGVEQWRSLRFLNAGSNAITSVAPLSTLGDVLETLVLNGNRIESALALGELHSLRRLDLADNRLREFGVLAVLPRLVELDLSSNRIGSLPKRWRDGAFDAIWLSHNRIHSLAGLQGLQLKAGHVSKLLIGVGDTYSEDYPRLRIDGNYLELGEGSADRALFESFVLDRGGAADWEPQRAPSTIILTSRLAAPGSEFVAPIRGWIAEGARRVVLDLQWDIASLRFEGLEFENDRVSSAEFSVDDVGSGRLRWRSDEIDLDRRRRLNDHGAWFAIRFTAVGAQGTSTRIGVTDFAEGVVLDSSGLGIPTTVEPGDISFRSHITLNGRVSFHEPGRPLSNIEIRWGGRNEERVVSDAFGEFHIETPVERQTTFEVLPPEDISTLEGVDVRDLILQRSLARSGVEDATPSAAIAADVDADGDVDFEDSELLESIVLGEFQDEPFLQWRLAPIVGGQPLPDVDSLGRFEYDGTGLQPNKLEWLLIRVGDLNGDAAP